MTANQSAKKQSRKTAAKKSRGDNPGEAKQARAERGQAEHGQAERGQADPEAPGLEEAEAVVEEMAEGAEPYEAGADAPPAGEAARVAELEAEVAKLKDQLLRALAEVENVRRRAERERQDSAKYAAVPLARDLLGVADNLRRALDNAPDSDGDEVLKQFLSGVEMTERELEEAFAKHGIERIDPEGERFDPHWHEAMFEVPSPDAEPGSVVQVVQSGYRLGERLLRPARVGVAKKA